MNTPTMVDAKAQDKRMTWLSGRRAKAAQQATASKAAPAAAPTPAPAAGSKPRMSWRSKVRAMPVPAEPVKPKSKWAPATSNEGTVDAESGQYKQAKLEESNIQGLGSKEDRDLRKASAASDPQFKGAGQKVGLEVWRVENRRTKSDTPDFGVKRWPAEEYGNFYSGDSYIVMNTYYAKDPETGKVSKDKLAWDLHFWLGKDSSQDEIGVAAYKTVELDTLLDDGPVQHRESQGNESKLFTAYFKHLNFMTGGVESGFRKVKPTEYIPRLLMVKQYVGSASAKCFEVPCAASSLDHGNCFVLDCGVSVVVWIGDEASPIEKVKAGQVQHNIVNSRNGKAKKGLVDDKFWKVLKGDESQVRSEDNPFEHEDAHESPFHDPKSVKLWRLSNASGKLTFKAEGQGKVSQSQLDSNDVFLVHSTCAIWVWIGALASDEEKSHAMSIADSYIKQNKLPNTMTVTALKEASARTNQLFASNFAA